MAQQRTWVEVDSEALRENVRAFRSILPKSTALLFMVKANAYGHGLSETVRALDDCVDWFGVDSPDEGALVKEYSSRPILITGALEKSSAEQIVRDGMHQIVSDEISLNVLSKSSAILGIPVNVHIKVDTGMNRQGVSVNAFPELLNKAISLPGINVYGIATHFANADEPMGPATNEQLSLFRAVVNHMNDNGFANVVKHAANSSAALTRKETYFDLVRIGIALYGVWPSEAVESSAKIELEPALSWHSSVLQIKDVPKGSRVGYGMTEELSRDSRLAVIPVGYADGYDRRLSRTAYVLIGGRRAKVIGNISMDMTTIDITDISDVSIGDTVTLLGRDGNEFVDVRELATLMDTIPYDVLIRINPMIKRVFV